jgi:hypothetical protein
MTAKLGKMPFVIETDQAVTLMTRAIARREATFTFPWQMRLLRRVLRIAPEWLIRRVAPDGAPRRERDVNLRAAPTSRARLV